MHKAIKNYPSYLIYEDGRVWSSISNKFLKPHKDKYGYMSVFLYNDKHKRKKFSIHRIVAEHFIENPMPEIYTEVNHKDENKENNKKENLEWCDKKYNNNYGTRNQRILSKKTKEDFIEMSRKANRMRSKSVIQYTLDKQIVNVWQSATVASKFGFSQSAITNCCNHVKKYKTHKGYIWEYA